VIPLAKQTMGKKKKGKKKKKKAAGGDTGTAELIPFDLTDTRRYVHVSMHMENWTLELVILYCNILQKHYVDVPLPHVCLT